MPTMDVPRHIVTAACLVRRDDGAVAMVRTERRGWECPGGQIEEGEDIVSGLIREVLEETGLAIDVDQLVGVYSNVAPPEKLMLDFIGRYRSGELCGSMETPETAWLTPEQAMQAVDHPAFAQRLRHMLQFDGHITYRAYTLRPYKVRAERMI
jgi:8-oxo-dGTP diphosphatase